VLIDIASVDFKHLLLFPSKDNVKQGEETMLLDGCG
jgi:hypothetical protein